MQITIYLLKDINNYRKYIEINETIYSTWASIRMAKDDDSGKSYYQALKLENEQMKAKLSVLESEGFLLRKDVDIENLYMYLKKNPKAAKFIYRKYPTVRDTLKEVCDNQNPLYLKVVADELKDTIEITQVQNDISQLESEKIRLIDERSRIDTELKEQEEKYNQLSTEAGELTKKVDNAQRLIANLTTHEARNRINEFYEVVRKFIEGVWKSQNGLPITEAISSVRLEWDQITLLKTIQKIIDTDLDYLTNKDLLSQEMLDEKRKKIKEEMDKEQDQALRAMDAFMAHNPIKIVRGSIKKIEDVQHHLNVAGEHDPGVGWFYNEQSIARIQDILDIPKDMLDGLVTQFEAVDRRKK